MALIFLSTGCIAAPGGDLVGAISDQFDTLTAIWTPGLRGMPEFLTIQNGLLSIRSVDDGDDPYPSEEDMLCTYADQIGRSLGAAEQPSIVAQIWLPPFDEWPAGTNASGFREWFGFRVTAYDAGLPLFNGFYWPGIYIATDDAGPCLIARVGDSYAPDVTIGRIHASGWWTLGLSWNEQGRTEYYAAPGRVTLTQSDLLHITPAYEPVEASRSIDQLVGTFLALRMPYPPTDQLSPNWVVDSIRVYVKPPTDIITSASPGTGGTSNGGGTFATGATVTVVANPSTGYRFVNWTEGGIAVSDSASYTFTASVGRTLVANFQQNSSAGSSTDNGSAYYTYAATLYDYYLSIGSYNLAYAYYYLYYGYGEYYRHKAAGDTKQAAASYWWFYASFAYFYYAELGDYTTAIDAYNAYVAFAYAALK